MVDAPVTVQLRAAIDDDLPVLFEHQRDPRANAMAAFPARDWDAFVEHARRIRADPTVTNRTILVDGVVAGSIVAWTDGGETNVGYWLGREFWGRGIATRALEALLGIVPGRPIHARVAKVNAGSLRVLEKCSFVIVGEDRWTPAAGHDVEEWILRLG